MCCSNVHSTTTGAKTDRIVPDHVSLELELGVLEQGQGNRARGDDELQAVDGNQVQADAHKASCRLQHCFDVGCHLPQHCLLDLGLHHACCSLAVVHSKLHLDDHTHNLYEQGRVGLGEQVRHGYLSDDLAYVPRSR